MASSSMSNNNSQRSRREEAVRRRRVEADTARLRKVEAVKIKVRRIRWETVLRRSLEDHAGGYNAPWDNRLKWAYDYIRRHLTNCDCKPAEITGSGTAPRRLRERVQEEIYHVYPELRGNPVA